MSRPQRVGVCLPNFPFGATPSRTAIVEVAEEAERLGFDSVWTTDHLLPPRSQPRYGHLFESLTTLAHLGALTTRVELGTSVLVLPMRHAVEVAKQAATIDALCGGRLVLGLGVGWIEDEYASLGADFHGRGRHLDEAIAVLRALWTAEDPRHDGERYHFGEVLFDPRPARPGGVPLWIGGNSAAAVRRAARLGDAWHADGLTSAELAGPVGRLRQLAGDRRVAVTLRRSIDLRPDAAVDAIGSGETPLTGVDATREELAALAELGAEHLVCQFEHRTHDEHLGQLRRFAAEFLPAR